MVLATAKLHRSDMYEALQLFNWLENVTLIVRNLMPPQQFNILLLKWFATMVILLVPNVIDHRVQM